MWRFFSENDDLTLKVINDKGFLGPVPLQMRIQTTVQAILVRTVEFVTTQPMITCVFVRQHSAAKTAPTVFISSQLRNLCFIK